MSIFENLAGLDRKPSKPSPLPMMSRCSRFDVDIDVKAQDRHGNHVEVNVHVSAQAERPPESDKTSSSNPSNSSQESNSSKK